MAITIENLFFYFIYPLDLAIIIQILFISFKKGHQKILWLLLISSSVNSLCNLFQSSFSRKEDEYLFLVVFTILEYFIFAGMFLLIIKSKTFRKYILFFGAIFLFAVINNYETGAKQILDSVPIGVETILILIYFFYYLYEQTNIIDQSFIYNRFHFWIVVGIILYLSGSFFIYILANQVSYDTLERYWFLTWVVYIIKDIFIIIGLSIYTKSLNQSNLKKFKFT